MSQSAWRIALHPLVFDDVARLNRHIVDANGDPDAGSRRISEIDMLVGSIAQDPFLGAPLHGALNGFRRRHGGTDRRMTIIYAVDEKEAVVRIHLVAFGGQNWSSRAARRPAARSERLRRSTGFERPSRRPAVHPATDRNREGSGPPISGRR